MKAFFLLLISFLAFLLYTLIHWKEIQNFRRQDDDDDDGGGDDDDVDDDDENEKNRNQAIVGAAITSRRGVKKRWKLREEGTNEVRDSETRERDNKVEEWKKGRDGGQKGERGVWRGRKRGVGVGLGERCEHDEGDEDEDGEVEEEEEEEEIEEREEGKENTGTGKRSIHIVPFMAPKQISKASGVEDKDRGVGGNTITMYLLSFTKNGVQMVMSLCPRQRSIVFT
ncbi:unnamed protein product [Enterobius vermicularis]|uniref:Uncharacterized protein n=1 Tax=Enterobius vermicularis TaxID=51028 RepID=A0A0N4VGM4_ENTVE|nr:unnamed protein product [Enterobius vermicularis]